MGGQKEPTCSEHRWFARGKDIGCPYCEADVKELEKENRIRQKARERMQKWHEGKKLGEISESRDALEFKTFERLSLEYFSAVANYFKGSRPKTAKALGIAPKTVYNMKLKCRELGIEVESLDTRKSTGEKSYEIFPTNEYRMKYRDDIANRDWL